MVGVAVAAMPQNQLVGSNEKEKFCSEIHGEKVG